MSQEAERRNERPDPAAASEVREDTPLHVQGSPTRCPYCHDGVSGEEPTVVCAQCLSRHHTACWVGSCASCRASERLVRDPVLAASRLLDRQGARLGAALGRAVAPASMLLWLITSLAFPVGLAVAFRLPEVTLMHGAAQLRDWLLGENWSAFPGYWGHGSTCPTEGWAGALLLLVLPALLGLSSAAAMGRSRGAPSGFALAALGLLGAVLLLPAWALISGAPFDPATIAQQRETLGWLLGLLSLPAVGGALGGLFASRARAPAQEATTSRATPSKFTAKRE